MKNIILSILTILLLTNCASNKRYNLNVKKGDSGSFKSTSLSSHKQRNSSLKKILNASIIESRSTNNNPSLTTSNLESIAPIDCDIIIFKSGEELSAKVIEIGDDFVKYKMCDNLEGPIFKKSSDDIFMIKHPNGTKTVFKEKNVDNSINNNQKYTTNSQNKNSENNTEESADIAGILSIIFGAIGLFFLPILFSTAAVVLGLVSLFSRKKKVLGWIGWALGLLGLLGWAILISLYY